MRALDQIDTWPVGWAAVGVVGPHAVIATRGERGRIMRLASVTKVVSTLALLVAAEEGTVDLDEPAGPPGATVRHLLAHASGLPFEGQAPIAAPGRRRIYSNEGFQVLGEHLASRSGLPFADYARESVAGPLDLGLQTAGHPGSGMHGCLDDLLALGRQLLAPTLIAPETLTEATSVQFPGLDGVVPGIGRRTPNDWGLGFDLHDAKGPYWMGARCSPRTFGHFGGSGTFLWVDPERRLACAGLTDRAFDDWALDAWPRLADAVLEEAPG